MDIYEIAGYPIGINREGVNFLEPSVSFQNIVNGFVFRQQLQSRMGFTQFGSRLGTQMGDGADFTRVMGIFEFILPTDEKELLAITKEYLYRFNATTNIWEQVPNNSADPFVSFGIPSNDDYVSGTTYPTKTNGQRFVFTGKGMSDVYFYNGTDVKRFTNTTDNPDYQEPAEGPLTRATYISWFGERLNLFVPVIDAIQYSQAVLYSGIRTLTGNGDKFNIPGAGRLSADTYNYITGATIAGDYMLINFNRSNWTLEKTRDAFNPYFFRKIPSVIGTDAQFSAVTWNNETKSIGKTGIISSDGKSSLRTDDQIPYFTADEISQPEFNLIYGGFDRINDQFLFAYVDGASTSTTQDRVLVHNYKESTWAINTQRFSVFGQTDKGIDVAWGDIDETINPSWGRMDTTEEIWGRIGLGEQVQKTLAGDNQSFIYDLNVDYDDYFVVVTGITNATSAVVTVDPCALQVGDVVVFENVEGMVEINGKKGLITAISTADTATVSITVNINSTAYTAYTTGGSVSKIIPFYAELVPFNPYRGEGRRVYVSHIEFLINSSDNPDPDTPNSDLLIDIFEDEDEEPFKSNVPVQTVGTDAAREWVTMTVDQESNFITIAMKQESADSQVIISSIRIHCTRGGYTSE